MKTVGVAAIDIRKGENTGKQFAECLVKNKAKIIQFLKALKWPAHKENYTWFKDSRGQLAYGIDVKGGGSRRGTPGVRIDYFGRVFILTFKDNNRYYWGKAYAYVNSDGEFVTNWMK